MGTINYRASDIITLGYQISCESDFSDNDIEQILESGWEDIDEYIRFDTDNMFDICKEELDNYDFSWFNVELKNGYYEGFYLDLDTNYVMKYLEEEDKQEIREEIKKLKELLYKLLDYMNVCSPWWCTTWYNYNDGKKMIDEAIDKLNKEIE